MILPAARAVLDIAAADGAAIRVRLHGEARPVRLFLSHGNGFAIDGYLPFWRHFLDEFEVVAFDMRHHGQCPEGDGAAHDYPAMTGDIELVRGAVEAEFGRKPAAGLFHSMSAQAALLAAQHCGWEFAALVLFDPPNVPPHGPARAAMLAYLDRLTRWAGGRRARFADPAELAAEYAATRAGQGWQDGAQRAMAGAVLRRDATGWHLRCPPASEAAIYRDGSVLGLWPRRGDFPGPVALIGSDPARPFPSPTALANQALAAEGGFDYAAIPGTGHLLQLEHPAACAEAALALLAGIGLR